MTLPGFYIYEILCFIRKNVSHITLPDHDHNTRNRTKLQKTTDYKTAMYEQDSIFKGTVLFNQLPCRIRSAKSFNSFKQLLKQFILHHSFYTINDFEYACSESNKNSS